MNATQSYRRLHESFIENHNGTSIWENIFVITPAPLLIYFVSLIKYYILQLHWTKGREHSVLFVSEFTIIVFFIILSLTVLSDFTHIIVVSLYILYFFVMKINLRYGSMAHLKELRKRVDPRPYITYYRTVISIMTCVSILAVDFHIFPRRFAKTETFGYGLMDTGVGFYMFANGIVMKQKGNKNIIRKSFYSSLPILGLGIIRYICIENLDYQRHITEYGIHWNFFFTLASVKLVAALLMHRYPSRVVLMAIIFAVLHQSLLSTWGQHWILSDSPRSNFISANKEGLISLPGYISLYLSSVAVGKFLSMPVVSSADDLRHSTNCFIWSGIFLILTLVFDIMFGVSRRLANITYITWMLTMSLFGISMSIFTEVALRCSISVSECNTELLTPNICLSINNNNLLFFLISNLFTGLVNLVFHTLDVSPALSLAIITVYKFCTCTIMYILYISKIKMKFW